MLDTARRTLLAAGALSCLACQVYTPIEAAPSAAGAQVRVTLTMDGTVHLTNLLGPGAASVDGLLTSATDSTVTVSVTDLTRVSGIDENWNGERVTIARGDASKIEREETSVPRSVLLAGALVAGVVFIGRAIGGGSAEGGATGGQHTGQ